MYTHRLYANVNTKQQWALVALPSAGRRDKGLSGSKCGVQSQHPPTSSTEIVFERTTSHPPPQQLKLHTSLWWMRTSPCCARVRSNVWVTTAAVSQHPCVSSGGICASWCRARWSASLVHRSGGCAYVFEQAAAHLGWGVSISDFFSRVALNCHRPRSEPASPDT